MIKLIQEDFDISDYRYVGTQNGCKIYKNDSDGTFIAVPEDGGKPFKLTDKNFKEHYFVGTFDPKNNRNIYHEDADTLEQAEKIYNNLIDNASSYPRKKGNDLRVAIYKITLDLDKGPQKIKSCVVTPDGVMEESKVRTPIQKKLQIRESQTGKSKLIDATQLGIVDKLSLDDKDYPYVLTDNGAYDLTKQGKNVIYTWVGKQHKGLRSLTSKQIGKLYDFIDKYVLPEFAKYCKTEKTSIHIDDFTNSTDMYRLWFEVSPTKSESTQVKNFRKSLIEKPVATATKTTGYKERTIALPKSEYHDIWEEGLEELLYDCKEDDDSVEWDVDYHGGMFGDTEVLYLYSYLNTYDEVKLFVQQFRDKIMYESKKRRYSKTMKEWTGDNYVSSCIPVYSMDGYRKLKEYALELEPEQKLIYLYTHDSLSGNSPYDKKRMKQAKLYHPEWFEIQTPQSQIQVLYIRDNKKAEQLFNKLERKALSLVK